VAVGQAAVGQLWSCNPKIGLPYFSTLYRNISSMQCARGIYADTDTDTHRQTQEDKDIDT